MDKNRGAPLAGAGEVTLVTYDDPLAKAAVLDGAARRAGAGALYLDFDLMRAGHLASGMLRPAAGVEEVSAGAGGVRAALAAAVSRASRGGCLVIVDSLNGLHRAAGAGAEIAVNASMMMLASAARQGGSGLAVACMARAEAGGGLVMVPMGRRVVDLAGARTARAVALPGGAAVAERAGEAQTALWEPPTSL
ncbi:MAG: hypothetical protein OXU85_00980 [Thaumarchaeota archaeon]|nr:hypothetical protein [Nitrososphaerota archaeon]RNJ71317.1 MAG: hypothetical protein EB832_06270 [Thaumarchaeota archaeon S14]RNJ72162.1 MAG: hypothetical protein EB833_05435 [Thaumarchaeota archaeon S13]